MKTLRLFTLLSCGLLLNSISFAQVNSDDPVNYPPNKPAGNPPQMTYNQLKTLVTSYTTCEGDSVTLTNGSTNCTAYNWSTDAGGTNVLGTNSDYTTGPLSSDTSFFITQYTPTGNGNAAMPAHSSVYTGNVRGYWFQAQSDFTITGFYVPLEASTGNTNVACVRFNSGPPPTYSATTNDFTLLGLWQNETADTMYSCITVSAGDYIGILGNRGDQNSYAPSPTSTTIDGNNTTITRLGMQSPLSTTSPQGLFTSAGGSISRVEFFYAAGVDSSSANVTEIDVTVGPLYDDTTTVDICQGDSLLVHGTYENTSGLYTNATVSSVGCDSTSTIDLVVNSIPAQPTLNTFSSDTICSQNGVIPCPDGSPTGGVYSGAGVTGSDFDPTAAGTGTHVISYVIVNAGICESPAATTNITVLDCASIDENTLDGVNVYPNPIENNIFIELPNTTNEKLSVELFDATGKLISVWNNPSNKITYDMSHLSKGLYVVHVQSNGKVAKFKVTKK